MKNLLINKLTTGMVALCVVFVANNVRADEYAKKLLEEYQPDFVWLKEATQYLLDIKILTKNSRQWFLDRVHIPNYDRPEPVASIKYTEDIDQLKLLIGAYNFGLAWMNYPEYRNEILKKLFGIED